MGCSSSSPKLYTLSPSSAASEMSTASDYAGTRNTSAPTLKLSPERSMASIRCPWQDREIQLHNLPMCLSLRLLRRIARCPFLTPAATALKSCISGPFLDRQLAQEAAHQLLLLRQAVHGDERQVQQAALVELGKVPLLLVVQATYIVHYGAHAGVDLCGTPRSCHTKAHQEGATCGTASDEMMQMSSHMAAAWAASPSASTHARHWSCPRGGHEPEAFLLT